MSTTCFFYLTTLQNWYPKWPMISAESLEPFRIPVLLMHKIRCQKSLTLILQLLRFFAKKFRCWVDPFQKIMSTYPPAIHMRRIPHLRSGHFNWDRFETAVSFWRSPC